MSQSHNMHEERFVELALGFLQYLVKQRMKSQIMRRWSQHWRLKGAGEKSTSVLFLFLQQVAAVGGVMWWVMSAVVVLAGNQPTVPAGHGWMGGEIGSKFEVA
jgi:hypothetical protein